MRGMKRPGRPPIYTPELAAMVCARLAEGESLRAICRSEGMPNRVTVLKWIHEDTGGFASLYARAKETGLDQLADETLAIADTPQEGEETEESETGVKVRRADMIAHRRLQVDTRKWLLSKLAPKKYGERTALELTGAGGGPVVLTDTDRASRIAVILACAAARQAEADVSDLL